jgi:hypothetical protein
MTCLSFQEPETGSNGVETTPRHLPGSQRTRFIYFYYEQRIDDNRKLLSYIFDTNRHENLERYIPTGINDSGEEGPAAKANRTTKRVVTLSRDSLLPDRPTYDTNSQALLSMKIYEHFRRKLVEQGTILWRLHTPAKEYFIMNEYADRGEIIPNSFAEVTYSPPDGIMYCTCETFRVLSCVAAQRAEDEPVFPAGILCMHCKFFAEDIKDSLSDILSDRLSVTSHLGLRLKHCRRDMNNPVVRLSATKDKTQKYSVLPRSNDSCSIINISSSGLMAYCTRGVCQASGKHKKSVKRLLQMHEAATYCEHLATMVANKETWAPAEVPEDEDEGEGEDTDDLTNSDDVSENIIELRKFTKYDAIEPNHNLCTFQAYN